MGFFYLPTKQEVEEFGQWIESLSIPRVQGMFTYFHYTIHTDFVLYISLVGP
jgi:hypothetical protein